MPAAKDTSAELMSAYLDAELAADDAAAFEEQLAHDPDAQSEFEQLRKVVSLVSSLPEVQAPPDFYEKVSKRVRRRQLFASEGMWGLVSLPFQVLSIIVILTVAALYMMAQLEQQPTAIERETVVLPAAPGSAPAEGGPTAIRP
ncbi:MAG: zf-HC2 domain-containing protein [Deltaproteobacteria bacterium]|nr:zf-HC2 domain-containing protein [Deltaproteobacteria bacterium]